MKKLLPSLFALALLGCSEVPVAPTSAMVPANAVQGAHGPPMAIVLLAAVFDPETVAREYGLTPKYVYRYVLNGFAAPVPELAKAGLMRDARVTRVSDDGIATISEATWGLDRIDQRALPLDNSYTAPNTGAGVSVYIVDTGIRFTHSEFGGRASLGWDVDGASGVDCNGHGSHVSGTAGGQTYGVAKAVTLKAVKVFPGCTASTTWSNLIAGLDWIAANASGPSVANLSLSGSADPVVDAAVANLTARGITVAVAAGNSASDACNYSPARAPSVITVAASTSTDARASFSNFGPCVDLFAPGSGITSAGIASDVATAVMNGTSMASPHVAGVAALVLSASPGYSPAQVDSTIKARATKNVITGAESVNQLLYSGVADDNTIPAPPPVSPPPPPPDTTTPPPPCTPRGKSGKCR